MITVTKLVVASDITLQFHVDEEKERIAIVDLFLARAISYGERDGHLVEFCLGGGRLVTETQNGIIYLCLALYNNTIDPILDPYLLLNKREKLLKLFRSIDGN